MIQLNLLNKSFYYSRSNLREHLRRIHKKGQDGTVAAAPPKRRAPAKQESVIINIDQVKEESQPLQYEILTAQDSPAATTHLTTDTGDIIPIRIDPAVEPGTTIQVYQQQTGPGGQIEFQEIKGATENTFVRTIQVIVDIHAHNLSGRFWIIHRRDCKFQQCCLNSTYPL